MRILTTFLWKSCAGRTACACALAHRRYTGGTQDLAQMLHEGDVHQAFTSRLHSSEMQTPGGSQEEILYIVLLLMAPHAVRADRDSLNARNCIIFLSPALQETEKQILMWDVVH